MQFYDRDDELVAGVGAYLTGAAQEGAVCLVIATHAHHAAFVDHLHANGIAPEEGSLVLIDAVDTLARLMPGGRLDRNAFFAVIGGLVRDAAATGRPVRAYGEMVALLWEAGDVLAAIDLEGYWNDLAAELPFSLYCAYHSDSVAGDARADALREVCRLHAAVVPAPGGEATVISQDFGLRPPAITEARRLVADALRRWGHDPALITDAELVVTELATNATLHARTPFRLTIHRYGPMLRISIDDRGPDLPAIQELDPYRPSGRGMHLIGAISRRWGVEVTRSGKTVWAELGR